MSCPIKKKIGAEGEKIAEKYLLSRGYKILKRNWFCYAGELDIVAFNRKLIFVEVKTLSRSVGEDPPVMLTRRKRLKWYHTSNYFLLRHHLLGADWRYDFVGVIKDGRKYLLRHYKNISIP